MTFSESEIKEIITLSKDVQSPDLGLLTVCAIYISKQDTEDTPAIATAIDNFHKSVEENKGRLDTEAAKASQNIYESLKNLLLLCGATFTTQKDGTDKIML
tara:strand:- start:490 stop:792 length:303 start_codon:yes stop_codon:yes gene_type:complete